MRRYGDTICPIKDCAATGPLDVIRKHWLLNHSLTRIRACSLCNCSAYAMSKLGLIREMGLHLFNKHKTLVPNGATIEQITAFSDEGPSRDENVTANLKFRDDNRFSFILWESQRDLANYSFQCEPTQLCQIPGFIRVLPPIEQNRVAKHTGLPIICESFPSTTLGANSRNISDKSDSVKRRLVVAKQKHIKNVRISVKTCHYNSVIKSENWTRSDCLISPNSCTQISKTKPVKLPGIISFLGNCIKNTAASNPSKRKVHFDDYPVSKVFKFDIGEPVLFPSMQLQYNNSGYYYKANPPKNYFLRQIIFIQGMTCPLKSCREWHFLRFKTIIDFEHHWLVFHSWSFAAECLLCHKRLMAFKEINLRKAIVSHLNSVHDLNVVLHEDIPSNMISCFSPSGPIIKPKEWFFENLNDGFLVLKNEDLVCSLKSINMTVLDLEEENDFLRNIEYYVSQSRLTNTLRKQIVKIANLDFKGNNNSVNLIMARSDIKGPINCLSDDYDSLGSSNDKSVIKFECPVKGCLMEISSKPSKLPSAVYFHYLVSHRKFLLVRCTLCDDRIVSSSLIGLNIGAKVHAWLYHSNPDPKKIFEKWDSEDKLLINKVRKLSWLTSELLHGQQSSRGINRLSKVQNTALCEDASRPVTNYDLVPMEINSCYKQTEGTIVSSFTATSNLVNNSMAICDFRENRDTFHGNFPSENSICSWSESQVKPICNYGNYVKSPEISSGCVNNISSCSSRCSDFNSILGLSDISTLDIYDSGIFLNAQNIVKKGTYIDNNIKINSDKYICPVKHCHLAKGSDGSDYLLSKLWLMSHFILSHSSYFYAECLHCSIVCVSLSEHKVKICAVDHLGSCLRRSGVVSLGEINKHFQFGSNLSPIMEPTNERVVFDENYTFMTFNWKAYL